MCSARWLAQSLGPEVPQDHPQFQRAEAPPELDAGVHQVPHARVPFARLEVLGCERERLAEHVHPPAIQHAQVERREQPLVRIDHESNRPGRRRAGSTRSPAPSRRRPRRRHRRAATRARARRWPRPPRPDRCSCSTCCRRSRRRRSAGSPAARSAAMAFASSSGRMRNSPSAGMRVSASWPRPSRMTALSTELCACSPQ